MILSNFMYCVVILTNRKVVKTMKSKSNKIIFSFLIISLVIIIIGYFLWAILIPIQDFSPMDKQETIRMQKELSLNYDLGRFLLYTGFSGLISSAILLISNKIKVIKKQK